MAVATHLGINLEDYDRQIRTFIPNYDLLLSTAAQVLGAIERPSPVVVDVGIGTGALAQACLTVRPDATICGVDEDAAILDVARHRLGRQPNATFIHGSFLTVALPPCDAIVASLALHHVRTAEEKRAFYRACHDALRPGGVLVSADCFAARDPIRQAANMDEWHAHLEQHYSKKEADGYFSAWAKEDVYFPLVDELEMLTAAGLVPDVVWRVGTFAVVAAQREDQR